MKSQLTLILLVLLLPVFLYAQNVVSTIPTQNELNVEAITNISVTFDVEMDETTIDANTFVVSGSHFGYYDGSYNYDNETQTATFDPDNNFDVGELISITLTTAIQDIDGDPLPEPYNWSFTIVVHRGTGVFEEFSTVGAGGDPERELIAGDWDGDGDVDLAVNNFFDDVVSIFINDGNGTFIQTSTIGVGHRPTDLTTGDFNDDGDLDLAVTDGESQRISILTNDGNGNFTRTSFVTPDHPNSLSTVDADSDGNLDLAVTHGRLDMVSIWMNDGNGTFLRTVSLKEILIVMATLIWLCQTMSDILYQF